MKKLFLIAFILCNLSLTGWADGWKLADTKVTGTGGHWENGQKIRIDRSYKKGIFQYERKVTQGAQMDVYSSKAVFSEPKKAYVAGEAISVKVSFSQKGEKQDFAPYAKVSVNGYLATDPTGRNTVTPPETVTLTSQAPSSGAQMTIVYACNGMEATYTYEWDGEMVAAANNTSYDEAEVTETNETWESYDEDTEMSDGEETEAFIEEEYEESYNDDVDDNEEEWENDEEEWEDDDEEWDSEEPRPIVKYLIVLGIAAVLIALILFLFNKKNKKTVDKEVFIEEEEPMMETPKQHVCPNCGAPITEGGRFCEECGTPLQPNGPKSTMTYGLTILILVALLQSCSIVNDLGNSTNPNNASVKKASTTLLKNSGVKGVKVFTLTNVDSKDLSRKDTKQLKTLAREIKDLDSYQVTVIGHTDNIGTSEVNEAVSIKRARLVADYLNKKGVKNITTCGESYNHPVAGNDTPAGRAKNRRVEIYVSTSGKYNPYK